MLDSAYFKRIAAIEFAVRFDDGVGAYGLQDADIVLVGVSRSSKTPLSIYLGYLGYKTANVPIVRGIEPPPELFELDPTKVVGVTIDAEALHNVRSQRARAMKGPKKYAELTEIYEELSHAEAIHRRLGCPVVEVSNMAIEETAHRIIRLVEQRRLDAEEGQRMRQRKPIPFYWWPIWMTMLALGADRLLRNPDPVLDGRSRHRVGQRAPAPAPFLTRFSRCVVWGSAQRLWARKATWRGNLHGDEPAQGLERPSPLLRRHGRIPARRRR